MTHEPIFQTRNLRRDFGRKTALRGMTLDLQPGRIMALLGPNGAGKTTLLKLLAGLLAPTAGEVCVGGVDPRSVTGPTAARWAALLDGHEPPGWATARGILALMAEAAPAFDQPFAEAFCCAGIDPRTPCRALSKGQRRRLLAGGVLASGATALLLDEPADGLDPAARRALYDALRERINDGAQAALVATHVIADIERVADDVALIREGELVLHAPLEELREQVREIEMPENEALPSLDGVDILAGREQGGTWISLVRCRRGAADLERRLSPAAIVRPVGLEALYLTLAGAEAALEQPIAHGEEG